MNSSSPAAKFFRKGACLLALVLVLVFSLSACSDPVSSAVNRKERKTVTHYYHTDDKRDEYPFPSEKIIDGKVYQLEKSPKYHVVRENNPPETSRSFLIAKPDAYQLGSTISVKGEKYQITKSKVVPKELTWSKVVAKLSDAENSVNKEYTDKDTKLSVTVPYQLVSTKDNRASWKDAENGFKINIVGYGGPYYQVGKFKLSGKSTLKDVKKKQSLILDAQGLDPENARVTDVDWDGSPYEDEYGNICRDILVHYQTRTPGYTAVYKGTVYRYDLSYIPLKDSSQRYYMEGIATYVLTNQKTTKHLKVAFYIILVIALIVAIIWYILYRRRKSTEQVVAGEGYSPDDF